jgi:dTDP-4-amino-4,6-dideoxygalactose transaminase
VSKSTEESFVQFSPPVIGEEEIAEVVDTLRSGWISTGPKTKRFEEEFTAYLGAPGALALNSCTAGLHAALATLGVGPGDEVITTPMTFCSSVNVIEHVGARPILADVCPDTLNIDPERVRASLSPRTRAILPVHFGGHPVDMAPIRAMAADNGLSLVEDAAHALPASYRGERIGAGDTPTAFSFYATKNVTTGEGGMLTGSPEFLDRARVLSLHGMNRDAWRRYEREGSWYYEVCVPGFKYNMSDVQAALGLWQLRKLTRFQQRRREIVAAYGKAFGAEGALEPPTCRPEVEHAWHLYTLRIRPECLRIGRDEFIEQLTARGIGTSVHFIPIHLHPYYRDKYGYRPEDLPIAAEQYRRIISLPLNLALTDEDVERVIEAVVSVARENAA